MRPILYLSLSLIAVIILSCKVNSENFARVGVGQLDKYEILKDPKISLFYNNFCGFFKVHGRVPESKEEFENFVLSVDPSGFVLSISERLNYGFIVDTDTTTLEVYEFGLDGKDDKLTPYYIYADDLSLDTIGDILLYTLPLQNCDHEKYQRVKSVIGAKADSITYYKIDTIKKLVREAKIVFIAQMRSDTNAIYVPKDRDQEMRYSLLYVDITDSGLAYEIAQPPQHDTVELKKYADLILTKLQPLNLQKDSLDFLAIPIRHYELDQLMKL